MTLTTLHASIQKAQGLAIACLILVWHGRPFAIRERVWSLQHPKFVACYRKTGNTNQIAVFVFYDVCFGVTMGTSELRNEWKSLSR